MTEGLQWGLLARAFKERREHLKRTQAELAANAGVSGSTVQKLESGRPRKGLPHTTHRLERALCWPDGAMERILHGEDPDVINAEAAQQPRTPDTDADRLAAGMPQRVALELRRGVVLDTAVRVLPTADGGRVVALWLSQGDDPPEAISPQALEEWDRVQRILHDVDTPDRPDR